MTTNKQEVDIEVIKKELQMYQTSNTADHLEIKNDVKEVKADIKGISDKIDVALSCKADKTELEKLDSRFWGIVVAVLMLLAGIVATWFKN